MAFHNTHADNSMEFSPYFLLFCQHMKTPIDNAIQGELPVVSPHFRTDLQTFIENVKLSRHIAIENLVHNSSINKTRYDNKDQDYRIEQHVWLLRLFISILCVFPSIRKLLWHAWKIPAMRLIGHTLKFIMRWMTLVSYILTPSLLDPSFNMMLHLPPSRSQARSSRAAFDFVGDISKTLSGTARVKDI